MDHEQWQPEAPSNGTFGAAPLESANVVLSIVQDGSYVAFAAYNEESNTILLENGIADDGKEVQQLIKSVQTAVRPTLLLVPAKLVGDPSLVEILTTRNENEQSVPYRIIKTASLDIRRCKASILKLRVRSMLGQSLHHCSSTTMPQRQRLHQPPPQPRTFANSNKSFPVSNYHALATLVDFDSKTQVQALGTLVAFLQQHDNLSDNALVVNNVQHVNSNLFVKVPPETLTALHIFATEHHPLLASKGTGNSKEGFSLFSLLDRTKSRAGRERLREWMLKPLRNIDAISQRQDGIELFVHMPDAMGRLVEILKHVGPLTKVLTRMQKGSCRPTDFGILSKTLSFAIQILEVLHDLLWKLQQEEVETQNYLQFVGSVLAQCHVDVVKHLFVRISDVIDEVATAESDLVVVKDGVHPRLDECKATFAQLGVVLKENAFRIGVRLPHLRDVSTVVFFPQVGFLVALQTHASWTNTEGALPDDFKYVFTEGATWYYKSSEMFELDEKIGDLDAEIRDLEKLVAGDLEDEIVECDIELRETFSALADLDCILSLARVASEFGYVRPLVVPESENCIYIENGGHPLQEHIIEKHFVRNHTDIDTTNRVNVLTGPNFSGKSCYARQVGILTYMAHIGSFLPCDSARISVVDRILAQFSTIESCVVPQSSFQFDLTRMGRILRDATEHSLVLVDEFGKGTSPASGVALVTAALRSLSKVGCKALCTTHFLEIFTILSDGQEGIKALQMSVSIVSDASSSNGGGAGDGDDDVLAAVPLFQLKQGVAESSAGIVCAKLSGVKQAVVERAHEIVTVLKQRAPVRPLPELLRSSVPVSTVQAFLQVDWKEASDDEVAMFRQSIQQM